MTLEDFMKNDVEFFMEHAEEYFALVEKLEQPKRDPATIENPYGAGGFGFIRSSKKRKALPYKECAEWGKKSQRWFEHIQSSFSCGADENAEEDWYALDREGYDIRHPYIEYKEAYYHFRYGKTKAEIAEAIFLLIEKKGNMNRTFSFDLDNISLQELKEYITAIEEWHRTGELNIGEFNGNPRFSSWKHI